MRITKNFPKKLSTEKSSFGNTVYTEKLTNSNRACIEVEQNQNCSNNWRTEIVLLDLLLSTLLQYLFAVFASFQFKKWFYSYTHHIYVLLFICGIYNMHWLFISSF